MQTIYLASIIITKFYNEKIVIIGGSLEVKYTYIVRNEAKGVRNSNDRKSLYSQNVTFATWIFAF